MAWDIIGHEWVTNQLERAVQKDSPAHAYLFTGLPGLGKARIALRLAQALNCEEQRGAPCLTCRSCKRIKRGNHPDVRIAGMASQGAGLKEEEAARQRDLKIATVREWQHDIDLRPYEARWRVFILHDADRLTQEAANAMLKTLEEPPPYAILILIADGADLLPTIVSRCQVLRLRPLARATIAQALQARSIAAEQAELIAALSGGRIGYALQLAEQPEELAARQTVVETLISLGQQSPGASFRWAEQRAKEYRGGQQRSAIGWLEIWQSWWRDVLLIAAGYPEAIVHLDRQTELAQAAQTRDLAEIQGFLRRISTAIQQLRENANPQLVFESLLLNQPR